MPTIALFTTTHRGVAVLKEIRRLAPDSVISVITASPRDEEPNYLPALADAAKTCNAALTVTTSATPFNGTPITPFNGTPITSTDVVLCSNWRWRIHDFGTAGHHGRAFVIHDSLLPKYRGFSPLHWAIRQGDTYTGATMFRPIDEIDAGPIVAQHKVTIEKNDTIATMLPKMTEAYIALIQQVIPVVLAGYNVESTPQHGTVSYAPKVDWENDPRIDPSWPGEKIRNHIRAFQSPYPSAFLVVGGRKVQVAP